MLGRKLIALLLCVVFTAYCGGNVIIYFFTHHHHHHSITEKDYCSKANHCDDEANCPIAKNDISKQNNTKAGVQYISIELCQINTNISEINKEWNIKENDINHHYISKFFSFSYKNNLIKPPCA